MNAVGTLVAEYGIFFLIIGGLILFHELGHFLAARATGVAVEEFGLGFPPRLVTLFQSGGTRFTLNLIPFGGFVRPRGEDDPNVPGGLASSPKRVRLAVLVAGAFTNFAVGLLLFAIGFSMGWPDRVAIGGIAEDSPAMQAGLRAGDVVLRVDGEEVHYDFQLVRAIRANLGESIRMEVERGEETVGMVLTPRTEWPEGQGPIGIELDPSPIIVKYPPSEVLGRASLEIVIQVQELLLLPSRIFSGELPAQAMRPVGLVGIKQLTDQAVEYAQTTADVLPLLRLAGVISVALGITNLLPLPALDGGRVLFVLVEAVRGRRLPPEREGQAHAIGFILLLALMVAINYNDIVNPIVP